MDRELYEITNPVTGEVHAVVMTYQEAIRCTHDLEFALQLIASQESVSIDSIEEAMATEQNLSATTTEQNLLATATEQYLSAIATEPTTVTEQTPSATATGSPFTETETQATPLDTIYRWRESNIYLLLNTYEEFQDKFTDPKVSQKTAWQIVAEEANKINNQFTATGPQCMSKMRALKKVYKTIKDHNSRSGNDRKTWKYYEKMNEIFGTRAWANPQVLVTSNEPPENTTADGISNTTSQNVMPHEMESTSTNSRGTRNSLIKVLEAKIEQRERHEAARQKRHEERLASDQALMQTIKDLLNSQ